MSIEAMKQWREALKEYCEHGTIFMPLTALKSIDQAIAEAEKQEPVALMVVNGEISYKSIDDDQSFGMWCPVNYDSSHSFPDGTKFYTHPQPKREPVVIDMSTMELAESVGLIGPESRSNDLHPAIQRFHDLICVNATVKAAQMAASAIQEYAQRELVGLTNEEFESIRNSLFRQEGWDGYGWDLGLKEAIEAKLKEKNT